MTRKADNEYQKKMCRFGNKGGGHRNKGGSIRGPKFKHQASVGLSEDDYQYLIKIKRMGAGSLSEELRRCVAHCREHDAIPQYGNNNKALKDWSPAHDTD